MTEGVGTNSDTSISLRHVHSLEPSIKDKIRRIILWVFVLIFILFEWHVIPPDWLENHVLRPIITSLLVVLAGGVIELLFDTRGAVDILSKEIKALSDNLSTPLRPLRDCTHDLAEKLSAIKPGEKVVIDHFGLDMGHAWDFVKEDILKHPKLKDVTIRILMLTDDVSKMGSQVPHEVQHWSANVPGSLGAIKTWLDNAPSLKEPGRRLEIEIKQYSVLPTIHGFSISQPIKVRYVSFCRWKGSEYIWGEDSYRTIVDDRDPTLRDEADIFEGTFERFWSTGKSILLRSYP